MTDPASAPHFDPAALAARDEPVRRYLTHALRPGAPTATAMRLTIAGHMLAAERVA